jgi:hypothetical protein
MLAQQKPTYLDGNQHSGIQEGKMNWVLDNIHLRSWACVHHDRPDKVLKDGVRDDKGNTGNREDLMQRTLRSVDTSRTATAGRRSMR